MDNNKYLIYTPHNRTLIEVKGDQLAVVLRNDVAMLVLKEKYQDAIPYLKGLRRNCESCGSANKYMFREATEQEIKQWKSA